MSSKENDRGTVMEAFSEGAVFGAVIAAVVLLVAIVARPKVVCGECGSDLPKFRKPKNMSQFLWGGQTCPSCGVELNARGKKKEK